MKKDNRPYLVTMIYDTETSNIYTEEENDGITLEVPKAYPVLFISNILKDDITEYEVEKSDNIFFDRYAEDFVDRVVDQIKLANKEYIPIVAAYNLMFDLQPVLYMLRQKYAILINAQSSRNAYTVDIADDDGKILLRFWDVSHLEPRGLWAMGEAAGIEKASGDWDYNLIRTPETPLTEQELFYAKRDVQVIPAYLKYLLSSNGYLEPGDLGNKLITKTSLVRLLSKRVIGTIEIPCSKKNKSLELLMRLTCRQEAPKSYNQYALRKACFRGGLTFTAANYASNVYDNVLSIDAVSMHHAHINGMTMYYKFTKPALPTLKRQLQLVKDTPLEHVLKNYEDPFKYMIHAKIKIKNLKLKRDSVFAKAGIATLAEAKFCNSSGYEGFSNELTEAAELAIKKQGFKDISRGSEETPRIYAFSKLMQAAECVVNVTELEWYIINLVYDYDDFEVIDGESSSHRGRAPEYVTLLSNMLYKQKDELKQILKTYKQGEFNDIGESSLPKHIKILIQNGEASLDYLESYYKNIIKGSYNAIYGSQAQDVYKPSFEVDEKCNIQVNSETIATEENFKDLPNNNLVLYTYGMRIVGRSRLHLILAMILLDNAFGDRIKILGGDTDSLKISVDDDVEDADIIAALEPLHRATDEAIYYSQRDSREKHPKYTSDLKDLGHFEIETYASGKYSRYKKHIELWNKCRISVDMNDKVHITCAGVSRPAGCYNLEDLAEQMIAKYGLDVLPLLAGYNTFIDSSISYLLQHNNPDFDARLKCEIIDYLGNTCSIDLPQSIALSPASKWIGESLKLSNKENLLYKKMIGNPADDETVDIWIDDDFGYLCYAEDTPQEKLYKVKRR